MDSVSEREVQNMPKNNVRDMTVGLPMPILLSFMMPLLLGLLFQQFYSMVDTVVVGNFLGNEALAGVGSTNSINFLVLGLCNGICAGFAIPVAQKFGEKDFDGLRTFVGNMIWLGGGIAILVTLVTTLACGRILTAMNTPADTFRYAYDYIFLIFLGIPATMLYNLLSGILRSLGDSRTPLFFLIFSSLLNVGLDLLCVVTLKMGVAGAGWATLVSQLISGILCLVYMAKRFPILRLEKENLKFQRYFARRLLVMGLPMGLQYSVTAIGSILLQTAVNGLGSVAMAAVTASGKVINLFACPYDAMGTTAATYAGQNLGAGKLDRVNTGVKDCAILGTLYALVALGGHVFRRSAHVRTVSGFQGRGFCGADPASGPGIAGGQCGVLHGPDGRESVPVHHSGTGYSNLAVIGGVFEMIARGGVALGLVPVLGFTAVCYASPAAWVLADLFLVPCYFYCVKNADGAAERKRDRCPPGGVISPDWTGSNSCTPSGVAS